MTNLHLRIIFINRITYFLLPKQKHNKKTYQLTATDSRTTWHLSSTFEMTSTQHTIFLYNYYIKYLLSSSLSLLCWLRSLWSDVKVVSVVVK